MKQDYVTVLQLTDLHLFADPEGLFNGIKTRDSFLEVLEHAQEHHGSPDVIVLTGDLAHEGESGAYQFISGALRRFSAPAYCILGNHDDPDSAGSVYPLGSVTMAGHCLLEHWQIITVDSNHRPMPGSHQGEVSEDELQRIAELTTRHADKWTLLAMHHNLPEHHDRGVAQEIRNHEQVMQRLEQIPTIKLVLSGHVHQEFVIVQNGICYLSTPSTGYQSKSKSGKPTGETPGYRWLKLHSNGRIETDVRRLSTWIS